MQHALDTGNNKVRVQFDLLPARVDEIEQLMLVCGIDTRKDLINNALTLLEWAVDTVQKGNEVASLDRLSKHYEVLRMPVLVTASKAGKDMQRISASAAALKQKQAVEMSDERVNSSNRNPFSRQSA